MEHVTQSRYFIRKMEGLYRNKKSNFALYELAKASRLNIKKKYCMKPNCRLAHFAGYI